MSSTSNKISKNNSKSESRNRITVSDSACLTNPDALKTVLALARGHVNLRVDLNAPNNKQEHRNNLACTLGCKDIVLEIMSYFSDEDLLAELMNYLKNFPGLINRGCNLPILKQRRVLSCKTCTQFTFLKACFEHEASIPNIELVLRISDFPANFISTIQKFSTVHLNGISIKKKKLMKLMSDSTSEIQHLKFTKFEFSNKYAHVSKRITPHLKKFTFNNSYENPIITLSNNINFDSSKIDELEVIGVRFSDIKLIELLKPKRLLLSHHNSLEHLETRPFLKTGVETITLYNPIPLLDGENHYVSTKVRKIFFCNSMRGSLSSFLTRLETYYPNCEELIIPETFFENITNNCLSSPPLTNNSLKRIIIKHSINTQPSTYGPLKVALSLIVPNATISLETILPYESKFTTLPSSNRTIKKDCYENLLFKRIEHVENQYNIEDSYIKNDIISMKKQYIEGIISNNFSDIEQSLNFYEGLKSSKRLLLQKFKQPIENYHAIFLNDELYQASREKLDTCNSIIGENDFDEYKFSQNYSELEALLGKMIETVETIFKENNYPSKILFNDQWFNDEFIEMNESVDEEIYEDSLIEMQQASSDLMNDDTIIELEEPLEE